MTFIQGKPPLYNFQLSNWDTRLQISPTSPTSIEIRQIKTSIIRSTYLIVFNDSLQNFLDNSRQLFACNFRNSHVEFNRRQTNRVTHELTRVVPSHASSHVYDNVPSCIRQLMAKVKQLISFLTKKKWYEHFLFLFGLNIWIVPTNMARLSFRPCKKKIRN